MICKRRNWETRATDVASIATTTEDPTDASLELNAASTYRPVVARWVRAAAMALD